MTAEFQRNPPWQPKEQGLSKEEHEVIELRAQLQAESDMAEENRWQEPLKHWDPIWNRPTTGVWRGRPYST
jgi:hypothetical protein